MNIHLTLDDPFALPDHHDTHWSVVSQGSAIEVVARMTGSAAAIARQRGWPVWLVAELFLKEVASSDIAESDTDFRIEISDKWVDDRTAGHRRVTKLVSNGRRDGEADSIETIWMVTIDHVATIDANVSFGASILSDIESGGHDIGTALDEISERVLGSVEALSSTPTNGPATPRNHHRRS